jgi:hypothetical protein
MTFAMTALENCQQSVSVVMAVFILGLFPIDAVIIPAKNAVEIYQLNAHNATSDIIWGVFLVDVVMTIVMNAQEISRINVCLAFWAYKFHKLIIIVVIKFVYHVQGL